MLHDAEAGHREALLQLTEGLPVPREERVEELAPGGIGQGSEDVLHAGQNR